MTWPAFWRPSSISLFSFVIAWFLLMVSICVLSFLRRLGRRGLCRSVVGRRVSNRVETEQGLRIQPHHLPLLAADAADQDEPYLGCSVHARLPFRAELGHQEKCVGCFSVAFAGFIPPATFSPLRALAPCLS